jgi:hypothetical protein
MSSQVLVLEQITLTAPFGVRFWDVATSAQAESGLSVIAYPNHFPELRTSATEGPSGVYSFSGLPGLRDAEKGSGDDAYWAANPPVVPYTVQITDLALRYLPFQFSVSLPVRELFSKWDSPISTGLTPGSDWLPIFSTPSRILPGPLGAVRATLQDDARGGPAAWTLLTVQAPGLPALTALADERGVVSLYQPYPEPAGSGSSSPLVNPNLTNQTWPITVSVSYDGIQAVNNSPDLDQVLRQSAAFVWRDSAHTFSVNEFQLIFGTELVLRSLDSNSGRDLPVLLVTSATSPL